MAGPPMAAFEAVRMACGQGHRNVTHGPGFFPANTKIAAQSVQWSLLEAGRNTARLHWEPEEAAEADSHSQVDCKLNGNEACEPACLQDGTY